MVVAVHNNRSGNSWIDVERRFPYRYREFQWYSDGFLVMIINFVVVVVAVIVVVVVVAKKGECE